MQIDTKEGVENIKQRERWFLVQKFGVQDKAVTVKRLNV